MAQILRLSSRFKAVFKQLHEWQQVEPSDICNSCQILRHGWSNARPGTKSYSNKAANQKPNKDPDIDTGSQVNKHRWRRKLLTMKDFQKARYSKYLRTHSSAGHSRDRFRVIGLEYAGFKRAGPSGPLFLVRDLVPTTSLSTVNSPRTINRHLLAEAAVSPCGINSETSSGTDNNQDFGLKPVQVDIETLPPAYGFSEMSGETTGKPVSSSEITLAELLKTQDPALHKSETVTDSLLQPREAGAGDTYSVSEMSDISETSDISEMSNVTSEMAMMNENLLEQKPDVVKSKAVQPQATDKDYIKEQKLKNFNWDLKSFVEACVYIGQINKALDVFMHYRGKLKIRNPQGWLLKDIFSVKDVVIYELLLSGMAVEGRTRDAMMFLSFMEEDGLCPSLKVHAACLECLGRAKKFDMEFGTTIVNKLFEQGYCLEDLFSGNDNLGEKEQYIKKALKVIRQGHVYQFDNNIKPYFGKLVSDLNRPLPKEQKAEMNPYADILTRNEIATLVKEQLQMESTQYVTVQSVAKQTLSEAEQEKRTKLKDSLKRKWRKVLRESFGKLVEEQRMQYEANQGLTYYPYLMLFSQEEYVKLMMSELDSLVQVSAYHSPSTAFLYMQLGRAVWQKYTQKDKLKTNATKRFMVVYKQYVRGIMDPDFSATSHRELWQKLCQEVQGTKLQIPDKHMSPNIMKTVGKLLYKIILEDLKINKQDFRPTQAREQVNAFYTVFRERSLQCNEEVMPHPLLLRLMENETELKFLSTDVPMVIPPVPWTSPFHGGHFLNTYKILRLSDDQPHLELLSKAKNAEPVYDSLTILGNCAWIINQPILDLLIKLFQAGGHQKLGIPTAKEFLPKPPKASLSMSTEEYYKTKKAAYIMKKQALEVNSLWYTELYRFSIANEYRNKVFWFPHSMDFRGRTYPIPPHFNHLGGDIARSMLKFAKGKPLGENGLKWLKIHLVNLTGLKKRTSNEERLAFAEQMMHEIEDSADYPLEGRKWWMSSEEPWQTLAFCMEIMAATRSPDHTQFLCHLPVHQDGSCNGLQHYAALGRDSAGAASVNLSPFDVPQDVYSEAVELVEKQRQKDAENGVQIAKVLEGFVIRKVIKQTIMTTVYGVTKFGAKLQIQRQLEDIPDFPTEFVFQGSMYLMEKTFLSLRQMFTSAREIQDWFRRSAHLISAINRQPVQWVTPLDLPVIQPYHTVSGKHASRIRKPNTAKQMNAFPPNFIHSLDSCHMMLTALYCLRAGITFVSVHDCFWTHASDVEVMNKVTRQQFVALHNQPILEDLSKNLISQYCSGQEEKSKVQTVLRPCLEKIPKRGDFNLENVLESTYFFS